MTKTVFYVLAIVTYVFTPIREIRGAAVTNVTATKSITDEIKSDKNICISCRLFVDSRYAKTCQNTSFPTESETLNDRNSKQFLCLSLYDRISRLCYLDSMAKVGETVLPANTTLLDASVEKLFYAKSMDPMMFCEKWKNPYPPKYNKTEAYVKQLERDMMEKPLCIKICVDWEKKLEPLCAILAYMDEISKKTIEPKDSEREKAGEKMGEASKLGDDAKSVLAVNPENTRANNNEKKQESTANTKGEGQATLDNGAHTDSTVGEKNKIILPADHSLQRNKQMPKTQISQSQKPTKVQAMPQQPETMNNKDNKKPVSETLEGTVQTPAKVIADTQRTEDKSVLPNNNEMDSPQAVGDQALADHDNSEEEPEKIPLLAEEQNEAKKDVISERTQDDEQLRGVGDPSEDGNEIESPILPSSKEEDTERLSPLPSEKREYVPRMPGIRNDDDSHFFGYFTVIGVICIAGYVGYHNKQKIFAMVLEGRRSRGGRGRRRPSTANYRKLDCTLEEAVTSQCNSNVTHVIY